MRKDAPGPAKDLRRLRTAARQRAELDDEIVALAKRLRAYDPPVPWATISAAAGYATDAGIMQVIRRHDKRAAGK